MVRAGRRGARRRPGIAASRPMRRSSGGRGPSPADPRPGGPRRGRSHRGQRPARTRSRRGDARSSSRRRSPVGARPRTPRAPPQSHARRVARSPRPARGAEPGGVRRRAGPELDPGDRARRDGDLPAAEAQKAAAGVALPGVSPGDPAYVFFTSGTSGVPKAVLGAHRGLVAFSRLGAQHVREWVRATAARISRASPSIRSCGRSSFR